MRTPFDQLAKCLLDRALEPLGTTQTEVEVRPSAQRIDMWFEPAPGRPRARRRLGLLGRMCTHPCALEFFHATPRPIAIFERLRKLNNFEHWRAHQAKRARRPRPTRPRLWLLSPGRPRAAIDHYDMQPMHDWPPGFLHTSDGLALHVVVLRELPATRNTLLLRLLGAGPTLAQAIEDLHALPEHAWERSLAIPLLLAFPHVLRPQSPQTSREETTMLPCTQEAMARYYEWERRTLDQGRQQGRKEGRAQGLKRGRAQGLKQGLEKLRNALMAAYQARFHATPADLQRALARVRDGDALESLAAVFAARSQDEIAAAVRAAIPPS